MRLNNKLVIIVGVVTICLLTVLYTSRARQMEQNTSDDTLHFISERVPLSFNYPKDWPVSAAGEEWEDGRYLDEERLEAIDFSEEFIPNARSDSYGYIVVTRVDIEDLEKYLTEMHDSECVLSLSIENTTIGNLEGYRTHSENDPNCGGTLSSSPEYSYYAYKDGLLYQIALTNPTYKNSDSDEIKNVFENMILTSVRFE